MAEDPANPSELASQLTEALAGLLSLATDPRTVLPDNELFANISIEMGKHALTAAKDSGIAVDPVYDGLTAPALGAVKVKTFLTEVEYAELQAWLRLRQHATSDGRKFRLQMRWEDFTDST